MSSLHYFVVSSYCDYYNHLVRYSAKSCKAAIWSIGGETSKLKKYDLESYWMSWVKMSIMLQVKILFISEIFILFTSSLNDKIGYVF